MFQFLNYKKYRVRFSDNRRLTVYQSSLDAAKLQAKIRYSEKFKTLDIPEIIETTRV